MRASTGLTLLLVVGLWSAAPSRVRAAGAELRSAGQVLYRRYCASCHGVDAKGGGPVAPALGQRPTDLTALARAHGGKFPFLAIVAAIDGTRDVRAHGVSEMPVWGEAFEPRTGWTPEAVAEARGRVVLITEYLRSIQAH
jgi:mono/diheme cytochrome c family protein